MKLLHVLRTLVVSSMVVVSGCATLPSPDTTNYGRFPVDYVRIVEESVATLPSHGIRTVTSVSEPIRAVRDDIAGWGVWARVRESTPNAVGGVDVSERNCYFLLRNGKIVLSDHLDDG